MESPLKELFFMNKREHKIIVYTDGGARGNPGPAGIGVVVELPDGTKKRYKHYIGKTTNNIAEYTALTLGLSKAAIFVGEYNVETVEVRADSELLIKQMNGEYKVKNAGLRPLFERAKALSAIFHKIEFVHIPREKNREADALVNEAIDETIE